MNCHPEKREQNAERHDDAGPRRLWISVGIALHYRCLKRIPPMKSSATTNTAYRNDHRHLSVGRHSWQFVLVMLAGVEFIDENGGDPGSPGVARAIAKAAGWLGS
jgi:hypothetical protein